MVYGLGAKSEHSFVVDVEMLDGNPAGIRSINQEPDGGVSFKGFTSGRPCGPNGFPTQMRWKGPLDLPIPDFDQSTLLNISARAQSFIEGMEPGIHQFVPVEYLNQSNDLIEIRYFWVICNRIDSVDRQHTTMVLRKGKAWRTAKDLHDRGEFDEIPSHIDPQAPSNLVYNRSQIGDAQVWRDKHIDGGFILISDEFAASLEQAGLTGFQLGERREEV